MTTTTTRKPRTTKHTEQTPEAVDPGTIAKALAPYGDERLRGFHRQTGTPVADALAAIPDYQAAARALVALGPLTGSLNAQETTAAAQTTADDVVREAMDAGRPWDVDSLWQTARDRIAEAQAREALTNAIQRTRTSRSAELDDALRPTITDGVLFGYVGANLKHVLDQTRELLPRLAGVTDTDSALARDRLAEWSRLRELHVEYRAVRANGRQLYTAADSRGGDTRNRLLYIGDPLAVWPDLVAHERGLQVEEEGITRPAKPAPWPADWNSLESMVWQAQHPEALPRVAMPEQVQAATAHLDNYASTAEAERQRSRTKYWRAEFANPEDRGTPQKLVRSYEARAEAWRARFASAH